jgi:ATP-dependent Clp protease ATP-binding subunit ClpA
VDEVICFHKLTEENFRAIARIMLEELRDAGRYQHRIASTTRDADYAALLAIWRAAQNSGA